MLPRCLGTGPWLFVPLAACNPAAPAAEKEPTPGPAVTQAAVANPAPVYTAEAIFGQVTARAVSFSADGSRLLARADEIGWFENYAYDFRTKKWELLPGATSRGERPASYFPADDRYLVLSDGYGDELDHLYVVTPDKEITDLTPAEKTRAEFAGWSSDRAHFYAMTNERDPRTMDVYRYRADDYERELVFQNDDLLAIGAIDPTGAWVVLEQPHDNADADLYLRALAQPRAKPKLITKHEGVAFHRAFSFTPDGTKLLYGTDAHGEFRQAWSYDVATGKHAPEIATDWDVDGIRFSPGGRYRAATINADAQTTLQIFDAETGKELPRPELPPGAVSGPVFSWDETRMAVHVTDGRSPDGVYVVDLATGAAERVGPDPVRDVDPAGLVKPEVVRFKSYDGLEIPSILYRPPDAGKERPVPALVVMHGGPGGQSRIAFRALYQFLANHGYALLAVNNRGSSGYGKTFYHLDDRKHGEVDLDDCVAAHDWLAKQEWVDGSKIGIFGGSYGGFLVLSALAFRPDVFDVGVDMFGVSNWIRTLESTPPWWTARRAQLTAELGDPIEDRERLERISPLFHPERITRPLLVLQGENDPRVLKVESDEIVAAVQKNEVPVDYLVVQNAGHGFDTVEHWIAVSNRTLRFLDEHLRR